MVSPIQQAIQSLESLLSGKEDVVDAAESALASLRAAQEGDLPPPDFWLDNGATPCWYENSVRLALAVAGGGVPQIDYKALIAAAYATNKKWAQGTNGCIAFKYGAEWFRDQMLASSPQPEAEPSEAEQVCLEAYQVVGSLLSDLGAFETDEAEKILDNLCAMKRLHKDVLPWPSFAKPEAAPAVAQVPKEWRALLSEIVAEVDDFERRLGKLPVTWPDRARAALAAAPEVPAQADPTDPGYDVEVLREHVRHLERRVRQLSQAAPSAGEVERETFETQMLADGYSLDFLILDGGREYAYMETQWAWRGWRAALATQPPAVQGEPLTDRIPCQCFDERSRNLCLNKQRCYQVFGLAADGIHSRGEGEAP